ncbi:Succinyl-CoA:(R)-benzylsuccinate CoA-transferase subunit BbsE [Candidatus Entotheonellaceae bacterium PAL068K]
MQQAKVAKTTALTSQGTMPPSAICHPPSTGITDGALQGVRVLDLSGEPGQFCGKLMGDLGADVIKIEPPGGDVVRQLGPFYEAVEDLDRSLYWHAINTSKRAITLNLEAADGRQLFQRLLPTADIVLESFAPGTLAGWGCGFDTLHQQHPHLILTSVTPFGQTGPYRALQGTDLEVMALSGLLSVCGDDDRPPVRISLPQTNLFASVSAFTGSMLAYYHRLRGGHGQHVDVSMQECATNLHYAQLIWNTYGVVSPRMGTSLLLGPNLYIPIAFPCKDGYVQAIPLLNWDTFIPWMKEHNMAGDLTTKEWQARLQTLATDWTQEQVDDVHALVAAFFARFSKRELYEEGSRRRQLLYPVQNVRDCLEDRQLQAREYFVEVEVPSLGRSLTYPGAPMRFSATPWQISGPAPRLGQHNASIYGDELGLSAAACTALQQEGVL